MGNFYQEIIQKDARFHSTARIADPALLEPVTRQAVEAIITDAKEGIPLMVFETYRSQARQLQLFTQGITELQNVGVHHYGLAADLAKVVKGQPSWDGDFSFLDRLAKKYGLIWGGDWGQPAKPHTFRDYDHVQRCSLAQEQKLFGGAWYPDQNYNPYGALTSLGPIPAVIYRRTIPQMTGDAVMQIQRRLQILGYLATSIRGTGTFGPLTEAAVMAFQRKMSLPVTGAVDAATLAALGVKL